MTGKKDIQDRIKSLWIKGMKVIGNAAASIANNTRYKVDEATIQNRRREVFGDLAHKAYALWLKGESFPEPMTRMLEEIKKLDEQLNDMRAEKYASSQTIQDESKNGTEETEEEKEVPEETDLPEGIPPENSSVSTEINNLFDSAHSVGKSVEKVNSALEQMSERIRNFPQQGE